MLLGCSLLAACEQDPRRFSVDEDFELCGIEVESEAGLPCAGPPVNLERGSQSNDTELIALWETGRLTAHRVSGEGVDVPFLDTLVSKIPSLRAPLVTCDFDGNGQTDVAVAGRNGLEVFLVWDLQRPGTPGTPASTPAWLGRFGLSCVDLDADGFDDLLAFDDEGGRLSLLRGASDGFQPVRSWSIPGYDGPFPPSMWPVRNPACSEPLILARPVGIENDETVAKEVDVFTVRGEELVQEAVLEAPEGDFVAPFAIARDDRVTVLLWLLIDDQHRLLFLESSGPCETDFQPILEVDVPTGLRLVTVDPVRARVNMLHHGGDLSIHAWGSGGTFELLHEVPGPVQDAVVVGPPDQELLVVARTEPPYFEVASFPP